MSSELPLQHGESPVLSQVDQVGHGGIESGVGIHGWSQFVPFGGSVLPICVCGWHGPFALDEADAHERLTCDRGEAERASAARRALVAHEI